MIKKVHISKLNEATFTCPSCSKSRTVDVSNYKRIKKRTRVTSNCGCGSSWTSILERRRRYRMAANIPCNCKHKGARGSSESFAMRVADLSSTGLKLKPIKNATINTTSYLFDDPIEVNFSLGGNSQIKIKQTAHIKNISEGHIGVEFDDAKQGDKTIGAYMLNSRHYQVLM